MRSASERAFQANIDLLYGQQGIDPTLMTSPYDERYRVLRQRLRDARILAGLTQDEVGRRMGRNQQFVQRCESGDRRIDVLELLDFADLYEASAEALIAKLEAGRRNACE